MWKIAKILNISIGSVFNFLNKYGIETRNQKETFTAKGRKLNQDQKDVISRVHKGKVLSDETKHKISESHKIKGMGHLKLRSDGYISVYFPNHPSASSDGYIMQHRLIMEKQLGRYLTKDEIVHHINFKRADNDINNLQLMNPKEHMSYHMKLRKEKEKIKYAQ